MFLLGAVFFLAMITMLVDSLGNSSRSTVKRGEWRCASSTKRYARRGLRQRGVVPFQASKVTGLFTTSIIDRQETRSFEKLGISNVVKLDAVSPFTTNISDKHRYQNGLAQNTRDISERKASRVFGPTIATRM